MDHIVRVATVDDAARLAAVSVASWQSAYRGLLPDDVLDTLWLPPRERKWAAYLSQPRPRHVTLVASTPDEILGFATVGPDREDTSAPEEGELHSLYLHPRHWRRGVGSSLHSAALINLHALGFRSAILWVLVGNDRAINFYRQAGWHPDGASRTDIGPRGVALPEIRLRRGSDAHKPDSGQQSRDRAAVPRPAPPVRGRRRAAGRHHGQPP